MWSSRQALRFYLKRQTKQTARTKIEDSSLEPVRGLPGLPDRWKRLLLEKLEVIV